MISELVIRVHLAVRDLPLEELCAFLAAFMLLLILTAALEPCRNSN